MTRIGAILAAAHASVILGGCAIATDAPVLRGAGPSLLRNGDFESAPSPGRGCPPSWWCTMHADTDSFNFGLAAGQGSAGRHLRVTRVKPEPWALVTQVIPGAGLVGKRVRMSVAVNAEGRDGAAGPVVILQGVGGRVLGQRRSMLPAGPGWRRASAEIDVVAGTEQVEFGLLVDGAGSVGFDDVEAMVVTPPGR